MTNEIDFEVQYCPQKNEDGVIEEVPALDSRWVDHKEFPLYTCLNQSEQVKIDAWCSNVETLIKLCEWLLCLPYHKFWSYIVYGNQSFHEMLDSYLEECPRYTQPELMNRSFFASKSKISQLQSTLDKKIFMILLRMSTRREAGIFQSVEHFGKVIYDNYLFDVPRMIDLCALYGEDNDRLVKRMIENIFKCQPKYFADLTEICNGMHKSLDKCIQNVDRTVGATFQILNHRKMLGSLCNDRMASDTVHFLVDFVYSLHMFLKIFPSASKIIHESGLTERLPSLFEKTYPSLFDAISSRKIATFSPNCQNLLERLTYFGRNLVKLFRHLVCYNALDPLTKVEKQNECDYKSKDDCINDFTSCMSHVVTEKEFAVIYAPVYPFERDIQLLHDKHIELDEFCVKFICDAFNTVTLSDDKLQRAKDDELKLSACSKTPVDVIASVSGQDNSPICQIRDIFPDLDINFIKKCLKDYSNNVEKIVNDLLTGVINPEIVKSNSRISNKTPIGNYKSDEINSTSKAGTSGISKNYHSDQSFANIAEDLEPPLVPLAHSKKRGNRNVLKDKTSIKESKAIYERYDYENDENDDQEVKREEENGLKDDQGPSTFKIVNPNRKSVTLMDSDDDGNGIYDDEYDDTYDSHEVNVEESNTIDEIESKFRKKETSADDDNDKTGSVKGPVSDNQPPHRGPWKGDYTGGKDRQYKERHKGRGAHHNRKDRALYKHSRGFGFY